MKRRRKKGNFQNKGDFNRSSKDRKPYDYQASDNKEATSANAEKSSGYNDLSWYVVDEQILNDAARLPYSLPVGIPFARVPEFSFDGTDDQNDVHLSAYDSAMPGILVSHIMPILGNAKSAGDPVNVAANSVFQFVRKMISGSRKYDAVDMMLYLGSMDSIFTYCTHLTRLYATIFTYHSANRYLARDLVEAQGVDYDSMVNNLSAFRARFNIAIAKIKSLYVPNNMSIFVRHAWMFSKYYIEGDSEKDQIYLHAPAGYYVFGYDADKAGMLQSYSISDGGTTQWNELLNRLDAMIDPIYQDEDFNTISGDLLKAYEGNVFTITEIPDVATVSLEHNEEVLLQFKNAKYATVGISGDGWVDNAFSYIQDSSKVYLKFVMTDDALGNWIAATTSTNAMLQLTDASDEGREATLAMKMMDISKPALLTSPHHDVTPGENMINTRLTLSFKITPSSDNVWQGKITDIAVGTEWPVYYSIHCMRRRRSDGHVDRFRRDYELSIYVDDIHTNLHSVRTMCESQLPVLSCFKYHPELFVNVCEEDENDSSKYKLRNAGRSLFDVDNYSVVDFEVIKGLHNAAILGQYNVPRLSVGK